MGASQNTEGKIEGAQPKDPTNGGTLKMPTRSAPGSSYDTIEKVVVGLSKRMGHEVDRYFVAAFFTKGPERTLDLPPVPRVDKDLCNKVAQLIEPVNVSMRDKPQIKSFLTKMFEGPSNRRLTSYELQLLEFALSYKDRFKLQFDYNSTNHQHERPENDELRVVLGGRHHNHSRFYKPQEAWSTFLHEIAHCRETLLELPRNNYATGIILSEVIANIYGSLGDIAQGIRETSVLYEKLWRDVHGSMPGFDTLNPLEKFRYISTMCRDDLAPEIAFMSHANELKEAFPQLTGQIVAHYQNYLKKQELNIHHINNDDFSD
jgi:hypothetical protein